jgi:NADH-quinone oxidoreductase subunit C
MDNNQALLATLQNKLEAHLLECLLDRGDAVVRIAPDDIAALFPILKCDSDLAFDLLLSITAVDWIGKRQERFELVYHLLSLQHLHRLRIKVNLSGQICEVSTISGLWQSANFLEREVWDMFGISFSGHPDLRRILMYDEFVGHPLRKDYPITRKQPRTPLRHGEIRNTSLDLRRPRLSQCERNDE